MNVHMDWDGLSDPGKQHMTNQDQMLLADLQRMLLVKKTTVPTSGLPWMSDSTLRRVMVVADGLSGNPAGDLASALAVSVLSRYLVELMPWYLSLFPEDESDFIDDLKEGIYRSHKSILRVDEGCDGPRCMATSLTMGFLHWPRLYLIHAGHTRAYLHRGGHLTRLTTVHSVARQLADHGVIENEDVEENRWNRVIWNTVGGEKDEVKTEVRRVLLHPGDDILLCTNGLTSEVDEARIAEILGQDESAAITCKALVGAAITAGGKDNITVALARFRQEVS